MNERIKQLIEECTTVENGVMQVRRNETVYHFDKVKFAELIVRECAKIIEAQDVDPAFKNRLSWAMKDKFGVREMTKEITYISVVGGLYSRDQLNDAIEHINLLEAENEKTAVAEIARLTKRKDECSNGWDEALAQRDKLAVVLKWLDALGGLGLDKHAIIREALRECGK